MMPVATKLGRVVRDGSRTAATSKLEHFLDASSWSSSSSKLEHFLELHLGCCSSPRSVCGGYTQWGIHKIPLSRGLARSHDKLKLNLLKLYYQKAMAIKRGRMVTYYEGVSPINSHNLLNMWSFEIIWQIKNFLSLSRQCLKPPI